MAEQNADGPAVTVTFYVDGPLLLRGDFELRTCTGERIEPGRDTVALCRCGMSAIRPFCDGTHKAAGFRAGAVDPAVAADRLPTVADTAAAGEVAVRGSSAHAGADPLTASG